MHARGLTCGDAQLQVQAENNSLSNTPNTFGIYILGLTMKWLSRLADCRQLRSSTNERRQSSTRK